MDFSKHNLEIDIRRLEEKINNPTGFFKSKAILHFLALKLFEKRETLAQLENQPNYLNEKK